MPLAKKTSTSDLPDALKNQITRNFTKESEPVEDAVQPVVKTPVYEEPAPVAVETPVQQVSAPVTAKSKYSDSVNLRLTSGKRNDFKKFFTDCEISMNQGFEMAVDYIMREARAGRITVSKSGINKVGE